MPYKDREARNAYARQWYERNKAAHGVRVRRSAAVRLRAIAAVLRQAKDRPCTDCGCRYPHYVMDFDHTADDKVMEVSRLATTGYSPARVLAEAAKCDIVCANCHRERTHQRRAR